MTDGSPISISRLAGQLAYLFDEQPELRSAMPATLADQLNHEDRFARARERYPLDSDAEIADKVAQFEPRITADDVSEALRHLPD